MKLKYLVLHFILVVSCYYTHAQKQYFTSLDGTKIAYTDEGEGFPVLLIHGFINTSNSWNKTVLRKQLLADGYRVIAPDLRGNGDSDKPHNDAAYADDAEVKDIIGLIDHLALKKYWSIGYSRGSIVLAKLLTQDKRIKKAVLGGMGVDFTNPNWDRRLLFAAAFGGTTTPETEGAVNYAKSINADLKSLHLQQVHQPVTSITALKTISAKVLVIAGDEDKDNGAPFDLHKAIPNSTIKIVKGDHNNTYKTADFAEEVCSFLY